MTDWSRIDLGGGANPRPGFFVVDLYYEADLLHDITLPFPSEMYGHCREAKFFHGPEHYPRRELPDVLSNIRQLMAPQGALEIRCPDMDWWCQRWLEVGATDDTLGCIFGGQNHLGQEHYNGLNFPYLERLLLACGFTDVARLSPFGEAPLYPDCWTNPGSADKNKQFDLHVGCRASR